MFFHDSHLTTVTIIKRSCPYNGFSETTFKKMGVSIIYEANARPLRANDVDNNREFSVA